MSKQVLHWKTVLRFSAVLGVTVGLVGCASYNDAMENQKTSYKRAEKRSSNLEVPPDLTAQNPDEYFDIPNQNAADSSESVTASGYYSDQASDRGEKVSAAAINKVQPVLTTPKDVEIRNAGPVRSLVIQKPAAVVFVQLREYWQEQGFDLVIDNPRIGLLETNWLENRAAIPMDGLRRYIGKVIDGIYSSNMRDKYRVRVEPLDDNTTEVFISHRGMEEVYPDDSQSHLVWQSRPSDPVLEAEMTNKFVAYLVGEKQASDIVQSTGDNKPLAQLNEGSQETTILVTQSFPEAWRVVGYALDRAGFIVEDRDRANGLYYVRYSPDSSVKVKEEKKGLFGKIFDFSSDEDEIQAEQKLQVSVAQLTESETQVQFLNESGQMLNKNFSTNASTLLLDKFPR